MVIALKEHPKFIFARIQLQIDCKSTNVLTIHASITLVGEQIFQVSSQYSQVLPQYLPSFVTILA